MTRPDDRTRLRHMLDHARTAARVGSGRTRQDLDEDETLRLALTRAVEIVGEAAARVSEPTRRRCPKIPWSQIIGARNRLIHGYDNVDLDVLWRIVAHDIPELIGRLQAILDP